MHIYIYCMHRGKKKANSRETEHVLGKVNSNSDLTHGKHMHVCRSNQTVCLLQGGH